MMQVDHRFLDGVRTVQAMFLHTAAGRLLLAGIIEAGHLNAPAENDQQRIERNFALRILHDAGLELIPQAADLEPTGTPGAQGLDEILAQGEPNDE
jgi:hypothetical protein